MRKEINLYLLRKKNTVIFIFKLSFKLKAICLALIIICCITIDEIFLYGVILFWW